MLPVEFERGWPSTQGSGPGSEPHPRAKPQADLPTGYTGVARGACPTLGLTNGTFEQGLPGTRAPAEPAISDYSPVRKTTRKIQKIKMEIKPVDTTVPLLFHINTIPTPDLFFSPYLFFSNQNEILLCYILFQSIIIWTWFLIPIAFFPAIFLWLKDCTVQYGNY